VTAGRDLRDAYARLVRERGLVEDAPQRAVVERLAELADAIQTWPAPSPLRRTLARRFPRQFALPAPRGIYLWGRVGRGKTWLLDLFIAQLPPEARLRSHFHHFMRDVHQGLAALGKAERPLEQIAARIARGTRVLLLDELYVADIGDAMILHGLFAALLQEGVVLAISSNWPPAQLYSGGLQRERFLPAIALLSTRLDVVELAGATDYRLRHLENASTYLLESVPDCLRRLTALFETLAEGAVREGGVLRIEGRDIPLRRSTSGMVWFDFAALCDGPRSQADYMEIAQEMHTVFITGVPVLHAQNDDAARRFVALVDEFYDRGVKLVVGAAAPPTALYAGERLRAAFERTSSRLIEMRSRDYLAREHRATS
jgi:cell division protein ZapE